MNKEKFRPYFAKKSQTKVETDVIQIISVLSSTTENIASAELAFAKEQIQSSYEQSKKNVKDSTEKIKKEVGIHAKGFRIA